MRQAAAWERVSGRYPRSQAGAVSWPAYGGGLEWTKSIPLEGSGVLPNVSQLLLCGACACAWAWHVTQGNALATPE